MASAATTLGLDFVVVTSVTRDDLPDGGASQFAATVRAVRAVEAGSRRRGAGPGLQGLERRHRPGPRSGPGRIRPQRGDRAQALPGGETAARDYDRSLDVLSDAAAAGSRCLRQVVVDAGSGRDAARNSRGLSRTSGRREPRSCAWGSISGRRPSTIRWRASCRRRSSTSWPGCAGRWDSAGYRRDPSSEVLIGLTRRLRS